MRNMFCKEITRVLHCLATVGLIVLPCSPAHAQTPALNGIAHVALRVHDLAASEAFYQKLGFVRAFELSRDGKVYEAFIKINDRQFIELYPTTPNDPDVGFLHLCFEGADLNAIHDDYVSRELTPISVRKAGAGNLLFTLVGPMQPAFPQNIEYTQYLPGSLHANDFGQHLGPDRVADRMISVALAMQDPQAARAFYLEKLRFLPNPGTDLLRLPGDSGETISIVSAGLGRIASLTLQSSRQQRSLQQLRAAGVANQPARDRILLTDPDGNHIAIVPAIAGSKVQTSGPSK